MDNGDVFSINKLRDGIKNLTKLYGDFGYIDFVPEPEVDIVPGTDTVDLTLTADEGKQFFVRRIEFTGNTTTRDKVIRRELLLDEGDIYSARLWDASILRLNQLGYFEVLKENESYELKRNPNSNTVDILSEAEGTRQEPDRSEWRRFRYRRQLRRFQLLHQQLPGTGRNAISRKPAWDACPRCGFRVYRTARPRFAGAAGLQRLHLGATTTIRRAKPPFCRTRI